MLSGFAGDLLHRPAASRHPVEMLLERRNLVGVQVEPALVRRDVDVADFPSSLCELLPARSVRGDGIQVSESVGLGYVPDPGSDEPTAAVAAWATDPGRVTGGLEGRQLAGRIDRLEKARLVVGAVGKD